RDRTRATIQSFSNLGLLEFTRKRIGKDLGGQLRGACPTCAGMGSVMSAQSVAIETFRQIRNQANGKAAGDVVVHVAPTVAVQMDYWYEEERAELARSIAHPIHVRVDPMIHPEKARIEVVAGFKDHKGHVVRVGDEHEVELLPGRLPNVTSAAAVVDGHLAEVENAANNAGNFVRIRIIDVEDKDDYVLAELVTAGVKSRRKRRPRRAEVSTAEQTRQLRELAEDAARQSASRPPIGITSITEEEEALDKALRAERIGEAQPDAIIIAEGSVHVASDGRRKRRRRRRGRGRDDAPATQLVEEIAATPAEPLSTEGPGQQRRRRRRRRGRRGRGGGAATMPDRHIFEVSADGAAHPTGTTAPPEPSRAIARRVARPPAVEAPPPSLTAPEEEPKRTKPARRRTPRAAVAGELEGTGSALALPAPKPRRTRKKAEAEEPVAVAAQAKPKTTTRKRKTTTTTASRKKKSS
ncbi:MAG TPA: hypothetical protein VHT92_07565, partial [Candidatus Cybelea sp.]|nr:hypothetical protein [Candidatus Cybelea sp.]